MKTLLTNAIMAKKLDFVIRKHMEHDEYNRSLPLYVPVSTMMMDTVTDHSSRVKILTATLISFIGESAPALKHFDLDDIGGAIEEVFEDIEHQVSQLRANLTTDKAFHKSVVRNYKTEYEPDTEEDEDRQEVDDCECGGCKARRAAQAGTA